ncbi:MAG: molecular chaperone DnaJ [Brevinemataceae bacterium]
MSDYYGLLEISRSASQDEIKKAFRKQAMKYHPDKNAGNKEAEEKFKEINKAYEILSDPEKRKLYDQYGEAAFQNQGGGGGFGGGFEDIFRGFGGGGFGGGFEDIFESFFGGGGGGRSSRPDNRGANLQTEVTLSLEQTLEKHTVELKIKRAESCTTCDGTGSKSKATPAVCTICHGSGRIQVSQGFFAIAQPCSHCHGTGKTVKDPCNTCHGESIVTKTSSISAVIPAGVDSGMKLRISEEGSAAPFNGPKGDLFIVIYVKKHPRFVREGDHLYAKLDITFPQAVLGGEMEVATLNSKKKIKLPEGVQIGQRIKLDQEGMPNIRSGKRGSLFLEVSIQIPKKVPAKAKDLLKQYSKVMNEPC